MYSGNKDDMTPRTGILLLTTDRYVQVAEFCIEQLRANWPSHPSLHVCGCSQPLTRGNFIPYKCASADWAGICLEAVERLIAEGIEYSYLILDDHPPFGPCAAEHLDQTIPCHARDVEAACVSLVGWDQYPMLRHQSSTPDAEGWRRNDAGYKWKFNLHPALWSCKALREILVSLRAVRPGTISARCFEFLAGLRDAPIPDVLKSATYRIEGDSHATGTVWFRRRGTRRLARIAIHALRAAAGINVALRQRVDLKFLPFTNFRNGPYPIYWSGILRQGRTNDDLIAFLRMTTQNDLLAAIEALPSRV